MKKIVLTAALLVCALGAMAQNELRMAVISDTHVMAPVLLKQDGKALEEYIKNDRKLLRESPIIIREAVDSILAQNPQVVLVTGDLTKDGEMVSHLYLRDSCLVRLREAGMKVLVIPGNHDVSNPHAMEFDGDKTTRVASPDKDGFAEIWADYGYGDALARDPYSLSYVYQLDDNTRILALDACRYEDNSFEENTSVVGGRLKKETIKFIKEQCKAAKKDGVRMIAMMHHGAVKHWDWQGLVMSDYLVKNWRKVARILDKGGIDVVFTGHFHSHDIALRGNLYDIETCSLLSYPSTFRFVTIDGDHISVRTGWTSGKDIVYTDGSDYQTRMKEYAGRAMDSVVDAMLPEDVDPELKMNAINVLAKSYVAHLAGNESPTPEDFAELKAAAKSLRKETLTYSIIMNKVGKNFWTDTYPSDFELSVDLRPVK